MSDNLRTGLRIGSEPDPSADSDVGSNERTDVRTDAADQNGRNSGSRLERVRAYGDDDDIVALGDVIAAGALWATNQRHELTREGERDPIPSHVRAAVWYRDHGKCADCHPDHPSGDILHLDHIQPWSAGGPDTTDNLRLLCERHNLKRSNYIDFARPKRPATWWCLNCYSLDAFEWKYYPDLPYCGVHRVDALAGNKAVYRCRVCRNYASEFKRTAEWPTWHRRNPIEETHAIAYCAHCDAPGLTDQPL